MDRPASRRSRRQTRASGAHRAAGPTSPQSWGPSRRAARPPSCTEGGRQRGVNLSMSGSSWRATVASGTYPPPHSPYLWVLDLAQVGGRRPQLERPLLHVVVLQHQLSRGAEHEGVHKILCGGSSRGVRGLRVGGDVTNMRESKVCGGSCGRIWVRGRVCVSKEVKEEVNLNESTTCPTSVGTAASIPLDPPGPAFFPCCPARTC